MSFFKFTTEIAKHENQTDLYKWLKHFDETGMAAGLVSGLNGLAVWRSGKRLANKETFQDKHEGTLLMWVNSFDKQWSKAGGTVARENDRRIEFIETEDRE